MRKNLLIIVLIFLCLAGCAGFKADGNSTGYMRIENGDLEGKVLSYKLGDRGPGGGIIFYVSNEGFKIEGYGKEGDIGYFAPYTAHYLEAAPKNSRKAQWGAYRTSISGVTTFSSPSDELASRIGNGRKDTLTIAAHLGTKETGRAAQIAAAANFGDLNDWFLPSAGELNLLYRQRNLKGIGILSKWYWSSSHYCYNNAWYQYFSSSGFHGSLPKDTTNSVRAVRAF